MSNTNYNTTSGDARAKITAVSTRDFEEGEITAHVWTISQESPDACRMEFNNTGDVRTFVLTGGDGQ